MTYILYFMYFVYFGEVLHTVPSVTVSISDLLTHAEETVCFKQSYKAQGLI